VFKLTHPSAEVRHGLSQRHAGVIIQTTILIADNIFGTFTVKPKLLIRALQSH